MNYIGEHLLPGTLGTIFLWVGFVSALLATIFYFRWFTDSGKKTLRVKSLARSFYGLHVLFMIAVAVVLYVIIFKHYFEYSYVWQYSSKDLPMKYIISCFWAGQEGSFLVWALFQALVGVFVMRFSRDWEPGVMSFFALSQVFVSSMLLGVHIGSWEIGTSPFDLLRDTVDDISGTIFMEFDYAIRITDGNGLNPLLENIWMTIHPPILFLGYALALVPFSYAMAALFRKEYHDWLKMVFPWTLLAIIFLGIGILLGGAWAYVSLTFGGFWAWDPVENSSLVPWITLVAALHFMLIARKQPYALMAVFIFSTLSYVLVLYASYLTRSGVLSETSAHSFGENGMAVQLVLFLLTFLILSVGFIILRSKSLHLKKKEVFFSREFWMFVGTMVMVLSAFQIIVTTSIPVFNAIFGTKIAPPNDAIGFYNRWQTPFALLVAGFIGVTQFLQYNQSEGIKFFRYTIISVVVSVGLIIPFLTSGIVTNWTYILFLFFILFALVSSLMNLLLKTSSPRNWAAMITHIGFAIFLLGVLITFSNSRVISSNTSGIDLGNRMANRENLLLMQSDTLYMGGYYVTYVDQQKSGNTTIYQVDFLKKHGEDYQKTFTLYPSVNRHPRMGNVYNPDTHHDPDKDYYTYIASTDKDGSYIVIKSIINPFINVLWLGSIVMLVGFIWALIRRIGR
jgi:cytochrome c-type biogenesis protein CcmF